MHYTPDPQTVSLLQGAPSQLGAALAAGNPVLTPEARARRVMRNYGVKTVSPRGGALSRYATRTGDLPLPRPQCLDPQGYACSWGSQPTEFAFMDAEVYEGSPGTTSGNLAAMGQQTETPELRQLPWEIGRPGPAPSFWERSGPVIGGIAGLLGIVLSWRALRGRSSR